MDWRSIIDEKEKYAAYLCSREWGVLKEAVRERAGGMCERCHFMPIDATHHLTYARKYNELPEDLQGICNPCHGFTHAKSAFDPLEFRDWLFYASACFTAKRKPISVGTPRWADAQFVFGNVLGSVIAHCEHMSRFCGEQAAISNGDEIGEAQERFDTLAAEIEAWKGEEAFLLWVGYGKPLPPSDKATYDMSLEIAKRHTGA